MKTVFELCEYQGNDGSTPFWVVYDSEEDDLIEYNSKDECGCNRGVHEVVRASGLSVRQIVDYCYPPSTKGPDNSTYLRMYAGEETGLFYRDRVAHEYRIMHSPDKVEIVVSTHGSFPICPFEHKFHSTKEAMEYLIKNQGKLDSLELPKKSQG